MIKQPRTIWHQNIKYVLYTTSFIYTLHVYIFFLLLFCFYLIPGNVENVCFDCCFFHYYTCDDVRLYKTANMGVMEILYTLLYKNNDFESICKTLRNSLTNYIKLYIFFQTSEPWNFPENSWLFIRTVIVFIQKFYIFFNRISQILKKCFLYIMYS